MPRVATTDDTLADTGAYRQSRPLGRALWMADSHLGGQRSYARGGGVRISARDDVGRVDPLRRYPAGLSRTLPGRREEQRWI